VNLLTQVRGRVVAADGTPMAGARVVCHASSVPLPEFALVSDAAGRFVIRLPPGRFTLRAHAAAGVYGDALAQVPATDADLEIVIRLGR